MEAFRKGDLTGIVAADDELCEGAGECGKKSIDMMIGALDGLNVKSEVLSYEGPFGVGYGVVALTEPVQAENSERYREILEKLTKHRTDLRSKEDDFVRLARTAIESFVEKRIKIKVPEYARSGLLGGPAKGAFVSIKGPGGLRGCIGSTTGMQASLAAEIINNAIQAATEDPRFPEIEAWELENLLISVDVLSKGELVQTPEVLDPKRYGVIVESGYRRGLLLPDLDGIETVEDQIRIALNMAGIREDDTYKIYRFTVERHV
jgi:AmmeMemoRadiSam system protein A